MIREDRFYKALGSAIKARRERLGLTQADLAEHLDLSRTSITNIERGRQRLLIDQFCRVAEILAVGRDELLAGALQRRSESKRAPSASVSNFVESVTRDKAESQ